MLEEGATPSDNGALKWHCSTITATMVPTSVRVEAIALATYILTTKRAIFYMYTSSEGFPMSRRKKNMPKCVRECINANMPKFINWWQEIGEDGWV